MHAKRGQVTIFIIAGIILLFSVALFLYFRNISIPLSEAETLPSEYVPVQNYVQLCVETLARRAIIVMGIQGGYLQLPGKIAANPSSYISIIPNGDVKLPFWYYKGEARVPTITEMQRDIGNYVSINLMGCLENFTPMSKQFSITPVGDITSTAMIGEEDVTIETTYPLSAKLLGGQETVSLSKFMARVPVRLRRMHQLAMDILRAENQGLLLENITVDLMALGPGDPPEGIPFSDMAFSCGPMKWNKRQVMDNIKNRLFYNLPRISFSNTLTEPPDDLYAANNLFLKVTDKDYTDLRAGVYYSKDWDFLMNVRPSRGDVMSASYGKGNQKYLSYMCLNVYHFTYDIEYPVQVTIRDEKALEGNGYDFSFATPVTINHNEGTKANPGFSLFEAPAGNDQGYCEHVLDRETVFYAKDALTADDVKGINISFTCVDTFRCPLGLTKPDGQVYRLRAKLPDFCTPGTIEAEGKGYIKASQDVTNVESMTIMLTPKLDFNLKIKKMAMKDNVLSAPKDLEEGQKAMVYLTTEAFPDFTQYKKLPLDPDSLPEDSRLELAEGDYSYHLDLLLMDEDDNLLGGYRGNWTPDRNSFTGRDTVTLYAMEKVPPPEGEDGEAQLFVQLENATLAEQLKPTFT